MTYYNNFIIFVKLIQILFINLLKNIIHIIDSMPPKYPPRNKKLKKRGEESSSSDDDGQYYDTDTDDSDYNSEDAEIEEEEETEEDDDSECEESSSSDDDEEETEDDGEYDESDFLNREEVREELEKTIKKMFPSKYADDKYKKTKSKKKKKEKKPEKPEKKSKRLEKLEKKIKNKKSKKESDDESVEEDIDDGEDAAGVNMIIHLGGGEMGLEEEYNSEDDNVDCDSDDEKTFMKEEYKNISISEIAKKKPNKKKKNKSTKSDEEKISPNIEEEYKKLVSLREKFNDELQKDPKDKTLIKTVKEYDTRIKKLVKDTRVTNAKKYHKLISSNNQPENEVDYFKKKLSHKEQLKVMNDLKEINKHINIDKPYRLTLLESGIPPQYKAIALQKLNMLKQMEPGDPEYHKLKFWVDAFMKIPFGIHKALDINMEKGQEACNEFMVNAKKSLDICAHGLNDAKMQIMQMLGQWLSNPSAAGSAIAIKGPMGTGKTTLIKEGISQILGREFAFIALGGNSDGSFLEGHSYTYEGSKWGKIVQILMDCKSMNPIIYFDELDKVSDTPRGEEIIGILTHLTDLSQNTEYHDKYFSEFSFDLSKCLFIFSYNDESKVNPILKDRMYRVETKGYSTKEKLVIAKDYLLPKIREQVKFKVDEVIVSDEAIEYIIGNQQFTMKEDGVRNLKRCLEVIHTKLNLFRLITEENKESITDVKLDIKFPFTVLKEHVDSIIKKNDSINPSLFGLYV